MDDEYRPETHYGHGSPFYADSLSGSIPINNYDTEFSASTSGKKYVPYLLSTPPLSSSVLFPNSPSDSIVDSKYEINPVYYFKSSTPSKSDSLEPPSTPIYFNDPASPFYEERFTSDNTIGHGYCPSPGGHPPCVIYPGKEYGYHQYTHGTHPSQSYYENAGNLGEFFPHNYDTTYTDNNEMNVNDTESILDADFSSQWNGYQNGFATDQDFFYVSMISNPSLMGTINSKYILSSPLQVFSSSRQYPLETELFYCKSCPKKRGFASRTTLKKHVQNCHGSKPECPFCKSKIRADNMSRHIKRYCAKGTNTIGMNYLVLLCVLIASEIKDNFGGALKSEFLKRDPNPTRKRPPLETYIDEAIFDMPF